MSTPFIDANPTRVTTTPADGALVQIDIELLADNPYQPRSTMDESKLDELAASIAVGGLLQPIAVRPAGGGRYEIVAGHRRVAAFKKLKASAGTDEERRKYRLIPATVKRNFDDRQMAVGAFVENSARADLNPLEEAAALVRIREVIGAPSAKELAAAVSLDLHRVRRLLRLHEAPKAVKDAVTTGVLVEVQGAEPCSDGAEPRRERRRLDLMAGLEFAKLHDHLSTKAPKAADERVGNAIRRALSGNWGFRRIQDFVAATISGRVAEAATKDASSDDRAVTRPIAERSPGRFTVHLDRLDRASTEDLNSLADQLRAVLSEVEKRAAKPASNVA